VPIWSILIKLQAVKQGGPVFLSHPVQYVSSFIPARHIAGHFRTNKQRSPTSIAFCRPSRK